VVSRDSQSFFYEPKADHSSPRQALCQPPSDSSPPGLLNGEQILFSIFQCFSDLTALVSFRIVLPIPRVLLPASKSTSPIPTLTERQFVVSKLAASKAEEDLTRTLFWYREELLRLVTATWKEVGPSWFPA
jgi:hypothetical protein